MRKTILLFLRICQSKQLQIALLFGLLVQPIHGQKSKDTIIDLGYGLDTKISLEQLKDIKDNHILCINNLSYNNLNFQKRKFISKNENDYIKKDFSFKAGALTIFSGTKSVKKKLSPNLKLYSYYTFNCNGNSYQYFLFFSVNVTGDVNKLFTGLIVENRNILINLPDKISTSNPNIFFLGIESGCLHDKSLHFIEPRVDFSDEIKLYTLKNKAFVVDGYKIILEPTDYLNYDYKINTDLSKWFKKIDD